MSPRLFGLDVARLVTDAIVDAGGLEQGVLIKNEVRTRHTFQGFYEVQEIRRELTLVVESTPTVTILGASVNPAVEPAVNDEVEIDNQSFDLVRLVSSDPAKASYLFVVR